MFLRSVTLNCPIDVSIIRALASLTISWSNPLETWSFVWLFLVLSKSSFKFSPLYYWMLTPVLAYHSFQFAMFSKSLIFISVLLLSSITISIVISWPFWQLYFCLTKQVILGSGEQCPGLYLVLGNPRAGKAQKYPQTDHLKANHSTLSGLVASQNHGLAGLKVCFGLFLYNSTQLHVFAASHANFHDRSLKYVVVVGVQSWSPNLEPWDPSF